LSGFLYGGEGSLWEAGSHSVATTFCREKPHLGKKRENKQKKTIKITLKKKKKLLILTNFLLFLVVIFAFHTNKLRPYQCRSRIPPLLLYGS